MNKRIGLILYIIFALLLITTVVIFSILGNKEREGYISDFNFVENIDNEYVYHIRIKYYDEKVFRNSEIFGVYAKDIENVRWDGGGSPFGIFISDKEMSKDYRIDIVYTTKIKVRVFIYVVLILLIILLLYKTIKNDSKIYKNASNIEYIPLDSHIEKIYSKFFLAFVVLLSFFIFSAGFIIPVGSDDWYFAKTFSYNIFDFSYGWWQRGRHIADIVMILPIGVFGKIGVGFGFDPITSAKVMHGVFRVIYVLGQIFALSTLIYLFNNKRQFKTIFILVVVFSMQFFTRNATFPDHTLFVSAYIGTAALSLAAWLPLAYFWIYDKELSFFRDNPNKVLVEVMYTFVLYAATFTLETSSLPIAGLSFFMLCYYLFLDKRIIKCDESKDKLPFSIIYFNLITIFLTIISITLTFKSGRGRMQEDRLAESNIKDVILYPLGKDGNIIATVVIFGIIYMIYLIIKAIKHKKISKIDYIKISLIAIGLLGAFGFSAILVGYALALLFIVASLILFILDGVRRKTILSQITIPLVIILMLFEIFVSYHHDIHNYASAKVDIKLVELFVEADAKNKNEILLTKNYANKNKLGFNRATITYMFDNGYTREIIGIRIIKDEDLEYEKSLDENNKKLIYSYPE